ncbi:MAG: hypothetical protein HQL36_04350 [Alphaproteobacteria bacterium]|nr:hypothetical protein [Alphaproteobacteria bacterium]MBF0251497.1 hypothetical protein [Alphaproteobacteria bacterium]
MSEETLRYDIWVEEALRSVIHKTLSHIQHHGLPGDHHFYISFHTQDDGVAIPGRLRAQHPNEMTIVLQYQFEDLATDETGFSVTLSFSGKKERLTIPYASIISFADPSVNFALQLKMMPFDEDGDDEFEDGVDLSELDGADLEYFERATAKDNAVPGDDADQKTGEVITLDAFRKK